MKDTSEQLTSKKNRYSAIEMKDMGAVKELTRGNALQLPWYETGIPPYNHWCPIC